MNFMTGFVIGVICGAVVMAFVYRNNNKKLTKITDELAEKYDELKSKLDKK